LIALEKKKRQGNFVMLVGNVRVVMGADEKDMEEVRWSVFL